MGGRARLARDWRRVWRDTLRAALFACTALWVPVTLAPGDATASAAGYALLRAVAAWARLPALGTLAPGEVPLCAAALALALFSALDCWRDGGHGAARVYLAGVFWVLLAASVLLSNPIAYGGWLFAGIAGAHWCALARVRAERGGR